MPIYKTNRRKDGKIGYRVKVNYTQDGKYKQVERLVYGLDTAKKMEQELATKVRTAPTERITLAELLERYNTAMQTEVREVTARNTMKVWRNHLVQLADVYIADLTVARLQKWKNDINAKGLKLETRKGIYKVFHALLTFAVRMEYIPKNLLDTVGNFRDPDLRPLREGLQYYTPDEFRRYMAEAAAIATQKPLAKQMYVFFAVAYFTGMRKGEIHALRWADITGDEITVRHSICQKITGKSIVETPPKTTTAFRTIKIPRLLCDILAAHRATQQQENPTWTEQYHVCGGITCLRDSTVEHYNRMFATAAGLPHIRIHDFRHSHATFLVNNGINIQEVARRLGHSNVQVTWERYAHLYPREASRAVAALETISFHD